jgi:hypothetical protein
MKDNYDFSQSAKNPYADKLNAQIKSLLGEEAPKKEERK